VWVRLAGILGRWLGCGGGECEWVGGSGVFMYCVCFRHCESVCEVAVVVCVKVEEVVVGMSGGQW
jgi:hypothetical protein